MNLKSYILSTCIACSLLACSSDDEPALKTITPIVPNASLDLTVDMNNKVKMKSEVVGDDAVPVAWDYAINRLTLVACNPRVGGAYDANNYSSEQIVAVFDYSYAIPSKEVIQSTGLGLLAGNTDFIVYANLTDETYNALVKLQKDHRTKTDVLALPINLENETEANGLTMQRDLGTLNVVEGKNYLGFKESTGTYEDGTEIYGKTLMLDRIVSCIQLGSLTLQEKDGCTGFKLKQIFLANVKGSALLKGETTVNKYWAGAFHKEVEYYKVGESELKETLCIVNNNDAPKEMKPGNTLEDFTVKYVYPNQNAETTDGDRKNYTLLVVVGQYLTTTNPNPKDSYYTILVNDSDFDDKTGTVDGKHIASNYKYTINLTIAGDGSDKPYTKPIWANFGVKISVADWNVVSIINPPLD